MLSLLLVFNLGYKVRSSPSQADSGVLRLTTPKIIKWLPNEAFIHKYSYTDVTTDY